MSRFVEPYQINADQRLVIKRLLDNLDISDEEGRRLFMLALEYELGTYQQVVIEHLQQPLEVAEPTEEKLGEIAKAAEQLSNLLNTASDETRSNILEGMTGADIFNRIADTGYLRSLQCELDRLAAACDLGLESSRQQQGPLTDASRKFITMLANIYIQCFEAAPTPGSDEPFSHILNTVVEQAGLQVRTDVGFVEETLNEAA